MTGIKKSRINPVGALLLVRVSGGSTIAGMDGVEETKRWVFVLLRNETSIRDVRRRKRRRAGRRSGLRDGCEASGLKWDFPVLIYLSELIAQGCLLAFCCMFCGLCAPFPLLPLCICKCKNVCVCVCAHLHLYCCCRCVSVCLHCVSEGLCLWACIFFSLHLCLMWSESLSCCRGKNAIFWDKFVLLCLCQTCWASTAQTRKATSSGPSLSSMSENGSDIAGHCRVRTRAFCLRFSVVVFFYKFMDICSNHTKINFISIRLKELSVNAVDFLLSVRVGFQMWGHFSIIYLIDFQPLWSDLIFCWIREGICS